jgi:hypothetical protein
LAHSVDPLCEIAEVGQESLVVVRVEKLLLAIVRLRRQSVPFFVDLSLKVVDLLGCLGMCLPKTIRLLVQRFDLQ